MNGTSWTIDHACPQCGAPIVLEETDRLLSCAFCRTRLVIFADGAGHFRHYIPPPAAGDADWLFVPYWRLRGQAYTFEPLQIGYRYVDTNVRAVDAPHLPLSLGLRPQAMKVKFVTPDAPGRFVRPQRRLYDAIPQSDPAAFGAHRNLFVGETASLIFTPLLLKNGRLHDPFQRKPLAGAEELDGQEAQPATTVQGQVRFLPALCPLCGWDLAGDRNALVLPCFHCRTTWLVSEGVLKQIPTASLKASAPSLLYLPFWRLRVSVEGLPAGSVADLIRLANLPRVARPGDDARPLHFWTPAFKIHPALFLRWSRQMTIFQPEEAWEEGPPTNGELHAATLPPQEGVEAVTAILGAVMTDKRAFQKALEELRISETETLLVYHPFSVGTRELTHTGMGVVMERNALTYGKTM